MDEEIDYTTGLPLTQPWQRAAARDITEILHLICCGEFENVQQLSQRLFLSAEGLSQMYASPNLPVIHPDDPIARFQRMLKPPPAPQLPPLPRDRPHLDGDAIAEEWNT